MERYNREILKVFDNKQLEELLKNFLIEDENFLEEFDSIIAIEKTAGKSKEDKIDIVLSIVGNESRTYILNMLVLKHLFKILDKNKDFFLDAYWKEKIKSVFDN